MYLQEEAKYWVITSSVFPTSNVLILNIFINLQTTIMKKYLQFTFFSLFLFLTTSSFAKTIDVGQGQQFETLEQAVATAQPGDKIIIHKGIYTQREDISNLDGEKENPIIIYAEEEGKVIFRGQSEAWHLSSCSNLFIYGIVFENQTSNGVNIDDSGNYDNSTFNITIKNCIFRDMNANGNSDLLKLSGLNDFTVENCFFQNGADGGSGIDMVGCHEGRFIKNRFENMGSNCIQVKGGSQYITITQNTFIDGGNRSLNLGGSTGLEYFRPHDAPFEAADVDVYSNIFIRSWAPIAYVGSTHVRVFNNTFFKPENWVFRILQETVDTSRFIACGDNEFSNNIIYFGDNLHRIVNIGPNTRPESFIFANNLWYNFDNPDFDSPGLPAVETNPVIQQNPLFEDKDEYNFDLTSSSPAIGNGKSLIAPELDFKERYFIDTCSIGAFEYNGVFKDFTGAAGRTVWHYHFGYPGDYQTLKTTDKETIDNKEVSFMENKVFSYDFGGTKMEFYLFTSEGITYFRNFYSSNNEFAKMYDYNLRTGDTLKSFGICYNPFLTIIDSVKFDFLAGKVRKIYITHPYFGDSNNCNYYFGDPGKLIEGIHSVYSFMLGNEYFDNRYNDSLRCYSYFNEKGIEYTTHFVDSPCDYIKVSTENPLFTSINIFPNPANDILNIDFKDDFTGSIDILDISGRIIISNSQKAKNTIQFDISSLAQGTYFVKLKTDKGGHVSKFVKI